MNPVDAIGRRFTGPGIVRAATAAEPLLRIDAVARALRAGIEYEALLRSQQQYCADVMGRATGRRTARQRWVDDELAHRARLAPGRFLPHRGGPRVFWHGPDRATGRPVVVLLNGWTASGLLWPSEMVSQLEESFDVVRVDNRGSGYSRTAPAPFTLARLAADVHDVLGSIGARSATVVGLSMGGMIAQELAINHPEVVDRLVLCGTRPPAPVGFAPATSVLTAMMSAPRPGERLGEFLDRTWGSVFGPGFRDAHPERVRELIALIRERPTPRAGVVNQLRAISSWSAPWRLARVSAPTVVIHGSDDPLIPVGNGMRLAQSIPGARYVELGGVGHIVSFEAPAALLDTIRST